MTAPDPAQAAAVRVDGLLEELRAHADPGVAPVAEELVRCLVQLYGDGLTRIMARLGPDTVRELCADSLVESLLLVHDLHPVPVDARIRQALEAGKLPVDLDGVDGDGVAHLRLRASGGHGAQVAVQEMIMRVAPELTGVDVQTPRPVLQIGVRPGLGGPPAQARP